MLIHTTRLSLEPISLAMVEAVMLERRDDAERAANAKLPDAWPNHALIERAFTASLDEIRADPCDPPLGRSAPDRDGGRGSGRGGGERRPSHGKPGPDGIAEVAYGVEESSRGQGIATEATSACVRWALAQEGIVAVRATTFPWHSSRRCA